MSTLRLLVADKSRAGARRHARAPRPSCPASRRSRKRVMAAKRCGSSVTRKPGIALLDISMPGLNGLEVAARVAQEFPATRVIIVSMHADDESVRRALVGRRLGLPA